MSPPSSSSSTHHTPATSHEEAQPLLPEPATSREASASSSEDSGDMAKVVKKNAWSGGSAVTIQLLALAFVAIIYTLVFTHLPFPPPLFGYHPLLQSLSILFLISSILTLQPTSQATPRSKQVSLTLHQRLNLFVLLPLLSAGASIMFYLHHPSSHWISWHGILGTTTLAWMWVQALFGGLTVWQQGKWLGGEAKAKSLWKWHRLSGYILIPLFLVTLLTGATFTTWSQQNVSTLQKVGIVVALAGIAGLGAVRVQTGKLPKLRSS